MGEKRVRIGITHGDINGINYEVMLRTFADPRICELCTPVVYGSSKVADFYKKDYAELPPVSFNIVGSAAAANPKKVNLVNCIGGDLTVEPGRSTLEAGQAAVAALQKAAEEYRAGHLDAIVTLPINKANVQSETFSFPGHTEFFTSLFEGSDSLMFMISDGLRVGLVTNHVPVSEVPSLVTKEAILRKLRVMQASLVRDFAATNPKIAILGLNPHIGDGGLIGGEEQAVIIPAMEEGRKEGMYLFGPYSPDGFFSSDAYRKFDAVLAMYHDEGMIPFKVLSGDEGVNFTAGLPLVRTSPAHGVAYDIAGKDEADPASFRSALYAAVDIFRNREIDREINRNPLPSYAKDNWGKDQSAKDLEDKNKNE